jgi:sugar phosphate isomerase/epimerase
MSRNFGPFLQSFAAYRRLTKFHPSTNEKRVIMTLPRLGAHTFGFVWQADAETALSTLIENGFSTLQLMATPPHFDPWKSPPEVQARIRSLVDRAHADLLAIDLASSDVNLASPAQEVVDFAIAAYCAAVERACELGVRWVCVGSGRRHTLAPTASDRLLDIYRGAFEKILHTARVHGLGIILENHPQGLLADASSMAQFLADYDDVPVIYDVANAFAIGEDPVSGLELLLPRIGVIHVSDAPRGQWRHDPIGSGDINFSMIGEFIHNHQLAGIVVAEIISANPLSDLVASRRVLRNLGWQFADGE